MYKKEYVYIPTKDCESFCLQCDQDHWMEFQTSINPIKGFKNIDQIYSDLPKQNKKNISTNEREGFKLSDKKYSNNILVRYITFWYYMWYNVFQGVKKVCTFVRGIF